jgi:macrolide transport system ATP-binding/permease protein
MFFLPMMQRPASDKWPTEEDNSLNAGALVVQTQRPMNNMEDLSRRKLSGINSNLAVLSFKHSMSRSPTDLIMTGWWRG